MSKALSVISALLFLGTSPLSANCPEALAETFLGEAHIPPRVEIPASESFKVKDWVTRVFELTQSSSFDSKMRNPRFEAEIQIIRYNFFRLPLNSVEETLDFMTSQLETSWGSLWMNEIQLIKMTVEHIQTQRHSTLLTQANQIEAAIKKRLPFKFSPRNRSFDSRPSYNYRTEW